MDMHSIENCEIPEKNHKSRFCFLLHKIIEMAYIDIWGYLVIASFLLAQLSEQYS